uniref:Dephospho-CoA kinase (Dephosphocoenzyme A kinase) n=1 Tax=mine drainage metagenome TaxID=410659 RepID=E6Q084_9ZZZZ
MLRVGLTGGLGSGKSIVARWLRELGAEVIEADELGRALMEPGQTVYNEIIRVFGRDVLSQDGRLDRAQLAKLAFEGGRLDDLNRIVHPAVIHAQREWMERVFAANPAAVAVVESALIFEVERDARARGESEGVLADWRHRFDRVIVVTAPEEMRIARYVQRVSPAGWDERVAHDARSRLSRQMTDEEKMARADFVLTNNGELAALRMQVEKLWTEMKAAGSQSSHGKAPADAPIL